MDDLSILWWKEKKEQMKRGEGVQQGPRATKSGTFHPVKGLLLPEQGWLAGAKDKGARGRLGPEDRSPVPSPSPSGWTFSLCILIFAIRSQTVSLSFVVLPPPCQEGSSSYLVTAVGMCSGPRY